MLKVTPTTKNLVNLAKKQAGNIASTTKNVSKSYNKTTNVTKPARDLVYNIKYKYNAAKEEPKSVYIGNIDREHPYGNLIDSASYTLDTLGKRIHYENDLKGYNGYIADKSDYYLKRRFDGYKNYAKDNVEYNRKNGYDFTNPQKYYDNQLKKQIGVTDKDLSADINTLSEDKKNKVSQYYNEKMKQWSEYNLTPVEYENKIKSAEHNEPRSVIDKILSPLWNGSIVEGLYDMTDTDSNTNFFTGLKRGLYNQFAVFDDNVKHHTFSDFLENVGAFNKSYTFGGHVGTLSQDVLNSNANKPLSRVGKDEFGEWTDDISEYTRDDIDSASKNSEYWWREGVGIFGDIMLDPTTYFTGGLSAIGKIIKGSGLTAKEIKSIRNAEQVYKKINGYKDIRNLSELTSYDFLKNGTTAKRGSKLKNSKQSFSRVSTSYEPVGIVGRKNIRSLSEAIPYGSLKNISGSKRGNNLKDSKQTFSKISSRQSEIKGFTDISSKTVGSGFDVLESAISDSLGVKFEDVKQFLKEAHPTWSEYRINDKAGRIYKSYNEKVLGRITKDTVDKERGLRIGFENILPDKKLYKELISARTLRELGDRTIAPYYNTALRTIRSTIGLPFSWNNKLLANYGRRDKIQSLGNFIYRDLQGGYDKAFDNMSAINRSKYYEDFFNENNLTHEDFITFYENGNYEKLLQANEARKKALLKFSEDMKNPESERSLAKKKADDMEAATQQFKEAFEKKYNKAIDEISENELSALKQLYNDFDINIENKANKESISNEIIKQSEENSQKMMNEFEDFFTGNVEWGHSKNIDNVVDAKVNEHVVPTSESVASDIKKASQHEIDNTVNELREVDDTKNLVKENTPSRGVAVEDFDDKIRPLGKIFNSRDIKNHRYKGKTLSLIKKVKTLENDTTNIIEEHKTAAQIIRDGKKELNDANDIIKSEEFKTLPKEEQDFYKEELRIAKNKIKNGKMLFNKTQNSFEKKIENLKQKRQNLITSLIEDGHLKQANEIIKKDLQRFEKQSSRYEDSAYKMFDSLPENERTKADTDFLNDVITETGELRNSYMYGMSPEDKKFYDDSLEKIKGFSQNNQIEKVERSDADIFIDKVKSISSSEMEAAGIINLIYPFNGVSKLEDVFVGYKAKDSKFTPSEKSKITQYINAEKNLAKELDEYDIIRSRIIELYEIANDKNINFVGKLAEGLRDSKLSYEDIVKMQLSDFDGNPARLIKAKNTLEDELIARADKITSLRKICENKESAVDKLALNKFSKAEQYRFASNAMHRREELFKRLSSGTGEKEKALGYKEPLDDPTRRYNWKPDKTHFDNLRKKMMNFEIDGLSFKNFVVREALNSSDESLVNDVLLKALKDTASDESELARISEISNVLNSNISKDEKLFRLQKISNEDFSVAKQAKEDVPSVSKPEPAPVVKEEKQITTNESPVEPTIEANPIDDVSVIEKSDNPELYHAVEDILTPYRKAEQILSENRTDVQLLFGKLPSEMDAASKVAATTTAMRILKFSDSGIIPVDKFFEYSPEILEKYPSVKKAYDGFVRIISKNGQKSYDKLMKSLKQSFSKLSEEDKATVINNYVNKMQDKVNSDADRVLDKFKETFRIEDNELSVFADDTIGEYADEIISTFLEGKNINISPNHLNNVKEALVTKIRYNRMFDANGSITVYKRANELKNNFVSTVKTLIESGSEVTSNHEMLLGEIDEVLSKTIDAFTFNGKLSYEEQAEYDRVISVIQAIRTNYSEPTERMQDVMKLFNKDFETLRLQKEKYTEAVNAATTDAEREAAQLSLDNINRVLKTDPETVKNISAMYHTFISNIKGNASFYIVKTNEKIRELEMLRNNILVNYETVYANTPELYSKLDDVYAKIDNQIADYEYKMDYYMYYALSGLIDNLDGFKKYTQNMLKDISDYKSIVHENERVMRECGLENIIDLERYVDSEVAESINSVLDFYQKKQKVYFDKNMPFEEVYRNWNKDMNEIGLNETSLDLLEYGKYTAKENSYIYHLPKGEAKERIEANKLAQKEEGKFNPSLIGNKRTHNQERKLKFIDPKVHETDIAKLYLVRKIDSNEMIYSAETNKFIKNTLCTPHVAGSYAGKGKHVVASHNDVVNSIRQNYLLTEKELNESLVNFPQTIRDLKYELQKISSKEYKDKLISADTILAGNNKNGELLSKEKLEKIAKERIENNEARIESLKKSIPELEEKLQAKREFKKKFDAIGGVQEYIYKAFEKAGFDRRLVAPNHSYFECTEEQAAALKSFCYKQSINPTQLYDMSNDTYNLVNQLTKAQMQASQNAFLTLYDRFLSAYKMVNTNINPGFHFQNAVSNAFQSFLAIGSDAFDLHKIKKSYTIIHNPDPKQVMKLNGKEYTYQYLNKLIENYNVIENTFFNEEISKSIGSAVGSNIEGTQRVNLFLSLIDKGHTPEEAIEGVNKFLFDYADLTPIEKKLFRRVIPFYTFMRKNIPLMLEQMMEQPFIFSTIDKAKIGFQKAGEEEYSNTTLNPYRQDDFRLPDINGQSYSIRDVLPYNQIETALNPRKMLSQTTPFLSIPVELATNTYNHFDGAVYSPDDPLGDLQYAKYGLSKIPWFNFAFRENDKVEDGKSPNSNMLYMIGNLTGMPINEINKMYYDESRKDPYENYFDRVWLDVIKENMELRK